MGLHAAKYNGRPMPRWITPTDNALLCPGRFGGKDALYVELHTDDLGKIQLGTVAVPVGPRLCELINRGWIQVALQYGRARRSEYFGPSISLQYAYVLV